MFDDTPELLRRLAEEMEGVKNFGVCFDVAHAALWNLPLGEWTDRYGSQATETKVYVGRCTDYFSKLGVGEFIPEASTISAGDKLMVTGNATGCLTFTLEDPRVDLKSVTDVPQGSPVSFKVPEKVRRGDKLYKLVTR